MEMKQKNRYGLSLDIGPDWRTLPYLKVSYAWSEFETSVNGSACEAGISPTGYSFSDTFSGFGIGGGVRHLQTENLYFFAEAMWQDYGSKTREVTPLCSVGYMRSSGDYDREQQKASPTNLSGVIGVGWKF